MKEAPRRLLSFWFSTILTRALACLKAGTGGARAAPNLEHNLEL